jgi:2-polyprenyl-3-methyl-5-hydroxy-6-metoxy-1,4-benzoquinol methylase
LEPVDIEDIYKKLSPDEIPWNIETPPAILVELIENGTVKPCKAIDLGCGAGHYAIYLAQRGFDVTGIDISRKLLAIAEQRRAERKLDNVAFLKTSLFDERFQPGSFDVVMAFYVLHFFEDIDAVFQRIHELLKPDGLIVSETACLGEKSEISGKLLSFAGHLGFLPKINLLTTSQLQQAMEQVGFILLDKVRFSESNAEYTLFARK